MNITVKKKSKTVWYRQNFMGEWSSKGNRYLVCPNIIYHFDLLWFLHDTCKWKWGRTSLPVRGYLVILINDYF